jgi:uncharacterized protein YciI
MYASLPAFAGARLPVALYAFVALKYRYPLERMLQSIDRHRAYLRELHAQGKLIASGPFVPREGGALLLRVEEEAEIQSIVAKDPFQLEGLVDTTIHKWAPNIGVEGLDGLAAR